MTLQELLDYLAVNELSNAQLSYINGNTGKILDGKVPAVVNFINEGLTKLYDTFFLKESNLFVELMVGKTSYALKSEHDLGERLQPDFDHYLWKGSGEKFEDDLLKILKVVTTSGINLPINDNTSRFTVYTPYHNVIQIPNFTEGWELCVTYQANHRKLSSESLNDLVEVPTQLLPALCAYVAHKAFSNMSTEASIQNSEKYYQSYARTVNDTVMSNGVNNMYIEPECKFYKGGWV